MWRTVVRLSTLGLLVGLGLALWRGPALVTWWAWQDEAYPRVCDDTARSAMRNLVGLVLLSGVATALVATSVGLLLRQLWRRRRAVPREPPAPPSP